DFSDRIDLDRAVKAGKAFDRLQFGSERKVAGGKVHIIDGLLAEWIACQQKLAALRIECRKCEHSIQASEGVGAPKSNGFNKHFRISASTQAYSCRFQRGPD